MKTLRCPLCGGSFELFEEGANIYLYQCLDCPLASSVSYTEKGALENAKELISKFPPIMRLNQGDKLKFFNHQMRQKIASIEKVNLKAGWIKTNKGFARPDDVILWPWELKQEGVDNGR